MLLALLRIDNGVSRFCDTLAILGDCLLRRDAQAAELVGFILNRSNPSSHVILLHWAAYGPCLCTLGLGIFKDGTFSDIE